MVANCGNRELHALVYRFSVSEDVVRAYEDISISCLLYMVSCRGFMILIPILLQEYKLLHPVVSKHERERQKRQKGKEALLDQFDEIEVSFVKLCFVAVFRLSEKMAL